MTDLSDLMRDLATRLDDIEDRIADLCEAGDVLLAIELFAEYDGLRTAMGRRTDDLARTIADVDYQLYLHEV